MREARLDFPKRSAKKPAMHKFSRPILLLAADGLAGGLGFGCQLALEQATGAGFGTPVIGMLARDGIVAGSEVLTIDSTGSVVIVAYDRIKVIFNL